MYRNLVVLSVNSDLYPHQCTVRPSVCLSRVVALDCNAHSQSRVPGSCKGSVSGLVTGDQGTRLGGLDRGASPLSGERPTLLLSLGPGAPILSSWAWGGEGRRLRRQGGRGACLGEIDDAACQGQQDCEGENWADLVASEICLSAFALGRRLSHARSVITSEVLDCIMNAACVMSLISVLASIPQPCRVLLFPLSVLELSTFKPWFLWRRPINVVKSWSVRLAVTRCCWR